MSSNYVTFFIFKTKWINPGTKKRCWSEYSSKFKTKESALKWYLKYGYKLEKLFNRKLKLFKDGEVVAEK